MIIFISGEKVLSGEWGFIIITYLGNDFQYRKLRLFPILEALPKLVTASYSLNSKLFLTVLVEIAAAVYRID